MTCPKCRAENPEPTVFCNQCGEFVGAESALAFKAVNLTVLRADLADFTKMSEQLDPEEVMGLLNLCFDRLGKIVVDRKGVVQRFIGDEMIALFGLPTSDAHSPMMALFAAQEMHNAVREVSITKITREHLAVKIGVETDLTYLYYPRGKDDLREPLFLGPVFAKALHLQKMARVTSTLVGETTYERAKTFFEFREAKLGLYQDQSFISYELLPL